MQLHLIICQPLIYGSSFAHDHLLAFYPYIFIYFIFKHFQCLNIQAHGALLAPSTHPITLPKFIHSKKKKKRKIDSLTIAASTEKSLWMIAGFPDGFLSYFIQCSVLSVDLLICCGRRLWTRFRQPLEHEGNIVQMQLSTNRST